MRKIIQNLLLMLIKKIIIKRKEKIKAKKFCFPTSEFRFDECLSSLTILFSDSVAQN
jgi:hypothetical protein